jgi:hypothetical protein
MKVQFIRTAVGLLVLVGCNVDPEAAREARGQARQAGREAQGREAQGREAQGDESQGGGTPGVDSEGNPTASPAATVRFDLRTLALPGSYYPVTNGRLHQGDIWANRYLSTTYPPRGEVIQSYSPCTVTTYGLYRNCGWTLQSAGTCTPGTPFSVGAISSNSCSLGACSGDMMLRVCEGRYGCDFGSSRYLGGNDDACGTYCPLASNLTCPASGRYTVMSAPYSSASGGSVSISVTSATYGYEILKGPQLTGATLTGYTNDGGVVEVKIASVRPEDVFPPEPAVKSGGTAPDFELGTTWLYQVHRKNDDGTYLRSDGGTYTWCGSNPDGTTPGDAIPVGYYWTDTGAMVDGKSYDYNPPPLTGGTPPRYISLGCTQGVVAKCYRWGYRPWSAPATMPAFMASCTRMARADYCGDGRSFTKDGTPINLWDSLPVSGYTRIQEWEWGPPDPELGSMRFEAAWQPNGARCLAHWRWDELVPDATTMCPEKLWPPDAGPPPPEHRDERWPDVCDTEADAWARYAGEHHRFFEESYLRPRDGGT